MKTFEFPYSGSGGPGDSWEGSVSVELTDEQAERLEASMASRKFEFIEDDESLEDICQIVWKAVIADTICNNEPEYLRELYDADESDSLEDCAQWFLDDNGASIYYPGTNWSDCEEDE